jgi:hypothetical protein
VGNALFLLALEMMISALRMTSPHGMNAAVMLSVVHSSVVVETYHVDIKVCRVIPI